jgi:hypothetical protein
MGWRELLGKIVVVDTDSSYIYIGRAQREDEIFFILSDVDVHDRSEGQSTKEKYIMEAKKFGLKPSRRCVMVRKERIVSISLLEDVIEF